MGHRDVPALYITKENEKMIALGCDHGGYELMKQVIKYLEEHGLEYKNYGTYSTDSVIIRIMRRKWQKQFFQVNAKKVF